MNDPKWGKTTIAWFSGTGNSLWVARELAGKIGGTEEGTKLPFIESRQLMDAAFWADDGCTGCGTCAGICPVDNIEMVDGRPVWQHRCEQCFACLQWCPEQALQFGAKTTGATRYHHPDVTPAEMLGLRGG